MKSACHASRLITHTSLHELAYTLHHGLFAWHDELTLTLPRACHRIAVQCSRRRDGRCPRCTSHLLVCGVIALLCSPYFLGLFTFDEQP